MYLMQNDNKNIRKSCVLSFEFHDELIPCNHKYNFAKQWVHNSDNSKDIKPIKMREFYGES